ncbi:hypothetical protein [Lacunimicrobium album]
MYGIGTQLEAEGMKMTCCLTGRETYFEGRNTSATRRQIIFGLLTSRMREVVPYSEIMAAIDINDGSSIEVLYPEMSRVRRHAKELGLKLISRRGEGYMLFEPDERAMQRINACNFYMAVLEQRENPSALNGIEAPSDFVIDNLARWGLVDERKLSHERVYA